jgi:hypothetical protein
MSTRPEDSIEVQHLVKHCPKTSVNVVDAISLNVLKRLCCQKTDLLGLETSSLQEQERSRDERK